MQANGNVYGIDYRQVPNFNLFMAGYVSAILFVETDDEDEALCERFGLWNLSPEFYTAVQTDCLEFVARDRRYTKGAYLPGIWLKHPELAGSDFWFTRQGHGVGFWAREEWKILAADDYLTAIAHSFGEANVYVGDDGVLYYQSPKVFRGGE